MFPWPNSSGDLIPKKPLKLENPNFKTLIKNLRFLTDLYLDGVNISTQSAKWCETTSLVLSNLRVLSLSNCGLKGPLCSSLSRLPFLSKLILDGNPISYLPPNFLEISSRLVSLSLRYYNLSGHFPTEILLSPKIQSIDISANDQLMGQLPEFPANNALQSFSLYLTNFSGKLPQSIGNLKFLTDLELNYCNFFGPIPSSIANLSHLVKLHLEGNKLSRSIHSSLFTLPSLKILYLGENQLVGKIDEFPNASSSLIQELHIGNNYLTGPIPKSILQLPKPELLHIRGNSFSCMKLDMFVQLNNLRTLLLDNISLLMESDNRSLTFPQLGSLMLRSCNLTEFPEFIKRQDKLVHLDLSNNHIHGVVPNWLLKSSLSSLHLSFNVIDFPKKLPLSDANFSFPVLRGLSLGSCNISAFPEFLKSQENLGYLVLSNNKISGAIPNWVWKKSLRYLFLANNHLSSLDQLLPNQSSTSSQTSLTRPICNLSQIKFSGELSINFLQATRLRSLKIGGNKLEGKLSRSLANCKALEVLDLGNNMVHNTFPFWLEKLPSLKVLILRANRFYGTITEFNTERRFPKLRILDIGSNNFSGNFSIEFLQSLKAMMQLTNDDKAKLDYIGEYYYQDSVMLVDWSLGYASDIQG
ncbi:hypothetical protein GOBAR_DD22372 [Gossypium barbadense]|nr:hypothetical protein GOBAR_DD22372 [Gossypium barbadense]